MWKFIIVTFGVLGLAFYELSGGADFTPEQRPQEAQATAAPTLEMTAQDILAAADAPPPDNVVDRGNDVAASVNDAANSDPAAGPAMAAVAPRLTRPLIEASGAAGVAALETANIGASDPMSEPEADSRTSTRTFASLSLSPDGIARNGERDLDDTVDALIASPSGDDLTEPTGGDTRSVEASALNVRNGPSTSDAVVGRLTRSQTVTVLSQTADGWTQIRHDGDGTEGWVASRFLAP